MGGGDAAGSLNSISGGKLCRFFLENRKDAPKVDALAQSRINEFSEFEETSSSSSSSLDLVAARAAKNLPLKQTVSS